MFFNRYYQAPPLSESPSTPVGETIQKYPVPDSIQSPAKSFTFPVKAFISFARKNRVCRAGGQPICKRAPEEIRRFRTTEDVSFDALKQHVTHVAKLQERQLEVVSMKYKDEDGDFINCDSDEEWAEALLNCNQSAKVCILSVIVCKQASSSDAEKEEDEENSSEEQSSCPRRRRFQHHHHSRNHHYHGRPHHGGCKRGEQQEQQEEEETMNKSRNTCPRATTKLPVRSIHTNIVCDGCDKHGLAGSRYKCVQCPDYDLCENCYAQRDAIPHDHHQFVLIEKPIPTFCLDSSFIIVNPHHHKQQQQEEEQANKCSTQHTTEEKKTEEEVVVVVDNTPLPQQEEEEEELEQEEQEQELEQEDAEEQVIDETIVEQEVEHFDTPVEVEEEEPVEEEPVEEEEDEIQHVQIVEEPVQEKEEPVEEEVVEPEPEPVPQFVEQEPAIDPAHATSLEVLQQMGFDNKKLALFLIRKHNNNVQQVVEEYLKHN